MRPRIRPSLSARSLALLCLGAAACTGPVATLPPDPPTDTDVPTADTSLPPVEDPWIVVRAGSYERGIEGSEDAWPVQTVTVERFAILRHEATAAQYAACLTDGACTPRPDGVGDCYDVTDPANAALPANCIDYAQATALCTWMGGRLPSESEWEFAARSRENTATYVWGDDTPDCTRANTAGLSAPDDWSCDNAGLWPVCSRPAGNSPLGLCDVAGNAFEWTADWYAPNYTAHPTDGSPYLVEGPFRTMRGGGVGSAESLVLGTRTFHPPDFWYGGMGVRCAMDL
jgi:formylglycine-generating enzyme required for sulfatase activity